MACAFILEGKKKSIGSSIADHPTLTVQIAHTVGVDTSARPVEGLFFKATTYNVFAPTYPVRVTIFVEAASISNLFDKAATI